MSIFKPMKTQNTTSKSFNDVEEEIIDMKN